MITTIIIFLVIYLLSAFGWYKFIQLAHYHPKGRWQALEPDGHDIFLIFCPIINTCLCIYSWTFESWKKEEYRDKTTNFFKPKK